MSKKLFRLYDFAVAFLITIGIGKIYNTICPNAIMVLFYELALMALIVIAISICIYLLFHNVLNKFVVKVAKLFSRKFYGKEFRHNIIFAMVLIAVVIILIL